MTTRKAEKAPNMGFYFAIVDRFTFFFVVSLTLFHITAAQSLQTTPNGRCGASNNDTTCTGSTVGTCCSQYGFCGNETANCSTGCQALYSASGACYGSLPISTDGACGSSVNETCQGALSGNCCSAYGYCGANSTYCGVGCQPEYGVCGSSASSSSSINLLSSFPASTFMISSSSVLTVSSPIIYSWIPGSSFTDISSSSLSTAVSTSTHSTYPPSQSGECGPSYNQTCLGSIFGDCCSLFGFCGTGSQYCGWGSRLHTDHAINRFLAHPTTLHNIFPRRPRQCR
jgi:Chitin recognition protein